MSKLDRKNIKVFGSNSSNTGKFGSAAAGSELLTTDIETMQSLAAWTNGLSSATIGGQKLYHKRNGICIESFKATNKLMLYKKAYLNTMLQQHITLVQ